MIDRHTGPGFRVYLGRWSSAFQYHGGFGFASLDHRWYRAHLWRKHRNGDRDRQHFSFRRLHA